MNKTIDFLKEDQEQIKVNIEENLFVNIIKISHSVAQMYFSDENDKKLWKDDIKVYTFDFENKKRRVIHEPINKDYLLCWTENYDIELNNEIKMKIKSQRKMEISIE